MTCVAGLSVFAAAVGDDSTPPPWRGQEGITTTSAVAGPERGVDSQQGAPQVSPGPRSSPSPTEQVATKPLAAGSAHRDASTGVQPVDAASRLQERPYGLLEAIAWIIDSAPSQLQGEPSAAGITTTSRLAEPVGASHREASRGNRLARPLGGSNGPGVATETALIPEADRADVQRSPARSTAIPTPPAERAVQDSGCSIIPRSPETEHLFDADDRQSNGVIIIRPNPQPADLPDGVEVVRGEVVDGYEDRGDSYAWWNWSGTVNIPDGPDGAWVGINCSTPGGIPAGAYVTSVEVHHEITHTYIGDLEVKVYNQYTSHVWMVRDNEGGSADNINETRTEYSLFDGDDPEQEWYYRVRDTYGSDTGTLDVMQLYVYYHWDEGEPDLEPYQPGGWDNKLVISNVTGTTTSASTIYHDEAVYVDWSCVNSGDADAGHFRYGLYLDGSRIYYVDKTSLAAGYYSYVLDSNLGTLSAGWHEFRIKCDYNYEVDESDEGNNEYARDFYITQRPQADLTPYQPGHWNDKIPVGITQLPAGSDHTYNGPYYSDETLYFNWGSVNNGDATASNYTVHFEVTGTGGNTWNWSGQTTDPGYWTYLTNDQAVGPLSVGSHTFKLWVDYDDDVDESNESNNYYERTITVEERPQADLTPYQPGHWNDKIPVGITQLPAGSDHTYNGPYYSDETLYFNWGSVNNGDATASNYTVHFEVTGTGGNTWNWSGQTTDPGYWTYLTNDQAVGPLSVGSHTFKLWVDYDDDVDESNESNNYYERTITVEERPQADLTPYNPANWDDTIPIGITQLAGGDAHSYSGPYYNDETLYFNWGSVNNGDATASNYTVYFEVTGTGGGTWNWDSLTTDPGYWTRLSYDQAVGPLAAGSHTFRFWVDYYDSVDESNESNNYYERTITVEVPLQADLTPYNPANWNDKIPIGITQLPAGSDHTYNGPYTSGQTLYFNWGSVNNGDATATNYTVHFEVTGTGGGTWDWSGLTTNPAHWTHLTNDQPVGPLAEGNHTFKLWVDYGDDVPESNEANNYYERTITVGAAPTWLFLYYFSNGGDLEGGCESKFRAIAPETINDDFAAYVMWDHIAGEDRVFRMKNDDDWLNGYAQGVDYWTANDIGLGAAEMDMGDPQTLNTFIDFVLGREQADHYVLVVFDHGGGIHPRDDEAVTTGICFDGDPANYLTINELGQCCSHLRTSIGRTFEILHLDACLMQMIEVNEQVRSHCDYVVASENEGWTFVGGTSWEGDYLEDITDVTTAEPLASAIANAYFNAFGGGRTISVLRQAYTSGVTTAVDVLAEALINNMRTIRGSLQSARNGTQKFAYFDINNTMTQSNIFLDLYDLCREINEHIIGMSEVNDAANAVINAIGNEGGDFVRWEAHQSVGGYDFTAGTFGVSVFFPESTAPGGEDTYINYVNTSATPSDLAFCASTYWDEFLRAYLEWQVLNVTSWGASNVAITATTDELGHGNGVTPFWRVYDPGVNVTLTAPSSAGGVPFAQWDRNGAGYSTNLSITFSMNDDYDFEAVYETLTCELTMQVSPPGSGTTIPSVGAHTYDCGQVVNISASAGDCYEFDHWNGPVAQPYSPNTTVEVTEDVTVTAVFSSLTPEDPNNAAADPPTICEGGSSTLTASVSGAEIDWYTGGCGGAFVGTGNSIVVSPASTTTYYARARDPSSGCESAGCDQVTVNVGVPVVGDLNCDCAINSLDVDPFVLAVTSAPGFGDYYAAYPDCNAMLGDCNSDGSVNSLDIDPFVGLLAK